MKMFTKVSFGLLLVSSFLTSTLSAGWMMINEDGSMTPYTEDCCKVYKPVKKKKRKKVCKTCDYSAFPEAQLLPIEEGEKLAPAKLGFCGKNR